MFDNKNSGWKKTASQHKELQTKDQVESEVYKQAAMADEAALQAKRENYDQYDKGSGKQSDRRGGGGSKQGDGQKVYLAKQTSHQSSGSGQSLDFSKGRDGKQQNLTKYPSAQSDTKSDKYFDGKS